ncbi:MAG: UDP-glucose/GDP-mannose dehydrogenase family protein [Candidatus Heimdallarchaeota archaeon]|nr:UDP-glucose/GDP-mannose dehydrogenase family protein [Candidatus Heimdallarchaeota archaeon]
MEKLIKVSVAGTGFVGLITAAIFADRGIHTIALDVDKEKVAIVNKGETFFFEPNLESLIKRVVLDKKTLRASTDAIEAIKDSNVTFICVGTPSIEDGSIDLQYVKQVSKDIGEVLERKDDYHLVVAKSTIVPNTTRNVIKEIIEQYSGKIAGKDFGLCMSPEFLREGQSVHDTIFPDRIIIGQIEEKSGLKLEEIFNQLYEEKDDDFSKFWEQKYHKKVNCPKIIKCSLETAECIKYANNSFLATKISFINEFANICERIEGVDINQIAEAIGLDFRINPHFLRAGAGFGGSCFPKDVNAIMHFAEKHQYNPELLHSVMKVNEHQALRMVELAEEKAGDLKGKKIALLGLSFKPDTDDMRNAPSIKIIDYLVAKGANVFGYDPKAMKEAKKDSWIGNKISYAETIEKALEAADVCLLLTEWIEFKKLQPADFKIMKTPILIDGRRIFDYKKFYEEGIQYAGIGLGTKK